jgi:CRISPR type III-B/RAMP module-associated protein Cmr3
MQTFDFIPADTLFCRDQRPLAAGSSFGHGANWPLPTVLHSAIRTALLRANGGLPPRNQQDGRPHKGKPKKVASTKYQWLNLRGPFPVDKAGTMYFPIPRDLVPVAADCDRRQSDGKSSGQLQTSATADGADDAQKKLLVAYLRIIANSGRNNLPAPLTHLAASFAAPSKEPLADWVSLEFYNRYLAGEENLNAPKRPDLWDTEHRIGVAIDPVTHTAEDGQLYAAEHLRLRDDVKLRFAVSGPPPYKPANPDEPLNLTDQILQLGGEQRFGKVEPATGNLQLPDIKVAGPLIKWVLLTPAIFIHGWRPGWIGDDGSVKLKIITGNRADRRRPGYDDPKYKPDESNDLPIAAKLVAAVVGKPQVIGGWDDAPKPTHLAVPSGSVYYFCAGTEAEANKLATALQGRCKSDFFGEKGLGLGVCGTWQHQQPTSGNVPNPATNPQTQ